MTKEDAIQELRDMLNGDIDEYGEEGSEYTCEAVDMAIEALQERKTGKWIEERQDHTYVNGYLTEYYTACSACGARAFVDTEKGLLKTAYCPWCGAKMTKEGGDEH